MSNEFIARKGIRVFSGNADVTGTLLVTSTVSASQVSGAFYGNGAGITGVISSSYAGTDWGAVNNKPTVVSSSAQVNSGSFSGSFIGSASFASMALSASSANSITFVPLTASYALTAGATGGGITGNGSVGSIAVFTGLTTATASVIFADATHVTMSVPLTASAFQGNGAGITGVISASYAGTDWTAINNKPAVFSSSLQLNSLTGPITGTITGSMTGSLQGSASYALTASYASNVSAADFTTLLNKPTLFSSSLQLNSLTGPITGTISGTLSGSVTGTLIGSASYATNAGSAISAISASYAPTDWGAINNKPSVFSSSLQLNSLTGPITGTMTGTLVGSASYATNAGTANTATSATSASYAGTDWIAINNKPTGIVSSSTQTIANIAGATIAPSIISASAINLTGAITALQFNTQYVSSSIIYQSGSTKFGDTQDDVMSVTGTMVLTGSLIVSGGSVTFVNGLGPTRIAGALYTTGSTTANIGTTVIGTVPTASYDSAQFQYVVRNSTGSRAGTVMSVWSASVVEYTDISTADIAAPTSDIAFVVDVLGDVARFKAVVSAINGWTVKGIIQAI